MELSELKKHIQSKLPYGFAFGFYLVFVCEDRAIADVYVETIAKTYGLSISKRDMVAEAVRASQTPSLDETERLYVVRDDIKFAQDEKGWAALRANSQNLIIALYSQGLNKPSFLKAMGNNVVTFGKMEAGVLASQVVCRQSKLSMQEAEALVSVCDRDYGLITLELDKVKRYAAETNGDEKASFWKLMGEGQLGLGPMNDRHHFVNSFVMGSKAAFDAAYGVDALELISLLYTQCRYMYLVLKNANSPHICKDTGMNYAQVNAYRSKKHTIKTDDLINVMSVLHRAESGIKTGTMPKEVAMKYVMARTFGLAMGR